MTARIDRTIRDFIGEHASRPPELDRTQIPVERGTVSRAVYLLARAAKARTTPKALQIALIDAGMALINADRRGAARPVTPAGEAIRDAHKR